MVVCEINLHILLYQWILHFQIIGHNYNLRYILLGSYLSSIFFLLASDNSLYSSKYVSHNSLYNSEAASYTFIFFSFWFFFLCFSFNLFKSLHNSTRKEYFHLKERLLNCHYHDNICKNYDESYILDFIYYSFQVLVFLF